MIRWSQRTRRDRALWVACIFALCGLGLMMWSIAQPTPVPVLVALSIGQLVGTASFALYLIVVGVDLRVRQRLDAEDAREPSVPPADEDRRAPSDRGSPRE